MAFSLSLSYLDARSLDVIKILEKHSQKQKDDWGYNSKYHHLYLNSICEHSTSQC